MTKARDLANIISTGVPNSLITLDAAEIPNISTDKLTTGTLANARVADLPTSKITSGTFADARISASSVTAHVTATDLTPVRQDILTLGLKQAVQENSTKFNLPNSAITKFEADADFNLAGSTTVARNADEFVSSTTTATGSRSLRTIGKVSTVTHSTTRAKWGTSSIYVAPSLNYLTVDGDSNTSGTANNFDFGTSDFTFEYWQNQNDWVGNYSGTFQFQVLGFLSSGTIQNLDQLTSGTENQYYSRLYGSGTTGYGGDDFTSIADNTWTHWAFVREGTKFNYYNNGTRINQEEIGSGTADNKRYLTFGATLNAGGVDSYFDDIRLTIGSALYTGTSFSVPTARLVGNDSTTKLLIQSIDQANASSTFADSQSSVTTVNATGTALGTTNVPSSAVTDVSGVMLLKNAYGTNTLGTDVKVYFTANNSNWTEATSYADAGTFSTGIKMIKLGKTTCTSGSDVRWKAVWANQVASSKEAHIYGIGLNY